MFEREITDGRFVNRWSIVRRLREQSIAEHSHLVTVYANDIATYLGLPVEIRLAVALYAPWHDIADEIFTGDAPGPNKRALFDAMGADAEAAHRAKLREWRDRTFPDFDKRTGFPLLRDVNDTMTVKLVVKTADWLEAAVAMGTEFQMGNQCTKRHVIPNMIGAVETAHKLCDHLRVGKNYGDEVPFTLSADDAKRRDLIRALETATYASMDGQSLGPWIAEEDARREGRHDPCFARK